MAPEVMMKMGHGIAADLFAVGVIGYECMLGKVPVSLIKRPYNGQNRKEVRDNILSKQAKITESDKPDNWSEESADFINQLLTRKQNLRLGSDKPGSARYHPWFSDFDWQTFCNFTMPSPFSKTVKIL